MKIEARNDTRKKNFLRPLCKFFHSSSPHQLYAAEVMNNFRTEFNYHNSQLVGWMCRHKFSFKNWMNEKLFTVDLIFNCASYIVGLECHLKLCLAVIHNGSYSLMMFENFKGIWWIWRSSLIN